MAKNLVIVESPAKAKTIKKFLGKNYTVEASMGHVRDLPKSSLGVSPENDFEPKYITIRGKGPLIANLKKEAKKADKIYLATDPDREGEAISWHLQTILESIKAPIYRITFNEITKQAVSSSIKKARPIDMDLVDAQQARRVLDRIVGYKISPLLWAKVKKGLSAGRVQSVALHLICEREKEIEAFLPQEYWTLQLDLTDAKGKNKFRADFYGADGKKIELGSEAETEKVLVELSREKPVLTEKKESTRRRSAPLPFKTSTLQQEAAKALNFTTAKTMRLAQQLYEGVDIPGRGTLGLITYLRTDSVRVAEEAAAAADEQIRSAYGEKYLRTDAPKETKKGRSQDAHEAIRPSVPELSPAEVKEALGRDLFRLYQLIWRRFMASRMAAAEYKSERLTIRAGEYELRASGQSLEFDGYLKLYQEFEEEESGTEASISDFAGLKQGAALKIKDSQKQQHFTQPPARYTEASLVKLLEENGVGRPSTYAPTISTILARGYVAKEQKSFFPTELGEIVDAIITKYFDDIVNIDFTAEMEEKLDRIEDGNCDWRTPLREFYPELAADVERAEQELEKVEIKDEETDILCEKCGRNMVIKLGRYGKFLACPGFPECSHTKPYFEVLPGVLCPKCGGAVQIKKTKKGRRYFGCENNPECDFMVWNEPVAKKCERCGSMMLRKGKKILCSNEACKHIEDADE
ncbi:type I DNA topoisomerase [Lachnospiraceae bacterium oral taxon 500]|nr:type I DNA topoisomerase [Lachnospiraceae bacterium oral taxon 500]